MVEDDQAIREILEIFLISENYLVQSFATVREFLSRDRSINPDLYLLDVMLPDGSGIDLCEQIKNDDLQLHIPVMIMSAHAQLHQMKNCCAPDDFVTKPFDIDNLLLRIKNMIGDEK